MRAVALLLVAFACVGLGSRVAKRGDQVRDELPGGPEYQKRPGKAPSSTVKRSVWRAAILWALQNSAAFQPVVRRTGAAKMKPRQQNGFASLQSPMLAPLSAGPSLPDDTTASEAAPRSSLLPRDEWPEKEAVRFLDKEETLAFNPAAGYVCQTPRKLQLFRPKRGSYDQSITVDFTLPGAGKERDRESVVSMELLQSDPGGPTPGMGAVQVDKDLIVGVVTGTLISSKKTLANEMYRDAPAWPGSQFFQTPETRTVVTDALPRSAQRAGLEDGDIIRAVSVPKSDGKHSMVILDGMDFKAFVQALDENRRVGIDPVLVVERRPNMGKGGTGPWEPEDSSGGIGFKFPTWGSGPNDRRDLK